MLSNRRFVRPEGTDDSSYPLSASRWVVCGRYICSEQKGRGQFKWDRRRETPLYVAAVVRRGATWYKGGEMRKVVTEDRELPLVMLFRPSHASCAPGSCGLSLYTISLSRHVWTRLDGLSFSCSLHTPQCGLQPAHTFTDFQNKDDELQTHSINVTYLHVITTHYHRGGLYGPSGRPFCGADASLPVVSSIPTLTVHGDSLSQPLAQHKPTSLSGVSDSFT